MLGTEPEVIETYVNSGAVQIVFWPVLNHGNPSIYSTITAQCAGKQDPDKFWQVHETLFLKQNELWGADRDYYVRTAVEAGVDQATFEACYDSQEALDEVLNLDAIRRDRGIFGQPYFDIGGQIFAGAPPFESFAQVVDAALSE